MNPFLGYPQLADPVVPKLRLRDPVRVPDERVGQVVGFYREDTELVLVRLEGGESRRYTPAELRLLIG